VVGTEVEETTAGRAGALDGKSSVPAAHRIATGGPGIAHDAKSGGESRDSMPSFRTSPSAPTASSIVRASRLCRRKVWRARGIQFGRRRRAREPAGVRSPRVREGELLFTFLAAVESEAGREYDRVIAVRAGKKGNPRVLNKPAEWLTLAADREVPSAGAWERHFTPWGAARMQEAVAAAGPEDAQRLRGSSHRLEGAERDAAGEDGPVRIPPPPSGPSSRSTSRPERPVTILLSLNPVPPSS